MRLRPPAALVLSALLACAAHAEASLPGHADQLALARLAGPALPRLKVTTPAFVSGETIPYENTQYRGNRFPGLDWSAGPLATRSYVVVMQGEAAAAADPGAARTPTSIHLVVFNIPPSVRTLAPGMTAPPAGASFGPNVHGPHAGYAGPHTHTNLRHAYHLQVFALDRSLPLPADVDFDALEQAMAGHVLASGEVVGVAVRDPDAPLDPPHP